MTVFVLSGSDVGNEVAVGNAAGAAQATKIVPIIKAINSLNSRFVNILISFGDLINADTVSHPYWRGAVPQLGIFSKTPGVLVIFTIPVPSAFMMHKSSLCVCARPYVIHVNKIFLPSGENHGFTPPVC
jgi:hypothetical protein